MAAEQCAVVKRSSREPHELELRVRLPPARLFVTPSEERSAMSAERSLLVRILGLVRPEPTQHVEYVRHTAEERQELVARAFGRAADVEEENEAEEEPAGAPRRLAPRPTA